MTQPKDERSRPPKEKRPSASRSRQESDPGEILPNGDPLDGDPLGQAGGLGVDSQDVEISADERARMTSLFA